MRTILWVDDDPYVNEIHRDELEAAGYNVQVVRNPDEMWILLNQGLGGLCGVIMDVLMPTGEMVEVAQAAGGMRTGLVLVEQLKSSPEYMALPIIIFTIRHAHDVDEVGARYGVPVLRKQGTTPEALLRHVQETFAGET